jgi:hypothetical protein
MTSAEAIANAEALLSGAAAPDGAIDPRWQAIIAVAEFIDSDPDAVLDFSLRWGVHPDLDLRQAIATCALEHLLESHFDTCFAAVERLARSNGFFAETLSMCSRFGDLTVPKNAAKLDRLLKQLHRAR